jgi:hypothetical protein
MTRLSRFIGLVALAACGGSEKVATGTPQLSDACALHTTADTCTADTKCEVRANGVLCPIDATTCSEIACVRRGAPAGAGTPGQLATCTCTGTDGMCVEQLGGPAQRADSPPQLSCRARPGACDGGDPCQCIAVGPIERCAASSEVQNLCECDNGVR